MALKTLRTAWALEEQRGSWLCSKEMALEEVYNLAYNFIIMTIVTTGLIEQPVVGSFNMQGQDILVYDHKIHRVNKWGLYTRWNTS